MPFNYRDVVRDPDLLIGLKLDIHSPTAVLNKPITIVRKVETRTNKLIYVTNVSGVTLSIGEVMVDILWCGVVAENITTFDLLKALNHKEKDSFTFSPTQYNNARREEVDKLSQNIIKKMVNSLKFGKTGLYSVPSSLYIECRNVGISCAEFTTSSSFLDFKHDMEALGWVFAVEGDKVSLKIDDKKRLTLVKDSKNEQ